MSERTFEKPEVLQEVWTQYVKVRERIGRVRLDTAAYIINRTTSDGLEQYLVGEIGGGEQSLVPWIVDHPRPRYKVPLLLLGQDIWKKSPDVAIGMWQKFIPDLHPHVRFELINSFLPLINEGYDFACISDAITITEEQRESLSCILEEVITRSLWPDGKYHELKRNE